MLVACSENILKRKPKHKGFESNVIKRMSFYWHTFYCNDKVR